MTLPDQSDSGAVLMRTGANLYRVSVIDRRTMETLKHGVSCFADSDIEASDTIRAAYPRKHFILVDRVTGQEVDL